MSGLNEWMYTLLLLMAFEAVTVTTQEQDSFSCIECHGIVGEVTNCGEVIEIGTLHTMVNCSGFCMKKLQYYMDQRIGVERNCTDECTEGCIMSLGTSTCMSCCRGDACNEATASIYSTHTSSLGLFVAYMALLLMASKLFS
ncbi:hypothetical protein BSL78_06384 [Apostichopus japonicus]|uniref:Uncharacterized protein n=1 Tax=Stichopus japonicus TaxID=307972 RepID=A0A2G8L916_STIJA|nr:hypothetical protein BSL78_06384 [Apostichopus japonicus]